MSLNLNEVLMAIIYHTPCTDKSENIEYCLDIANPSTSFPGGGGIKSNPVLPYQPNEYYLFGLETSKIWKEADVVQHIAAATLNQNQSLCILENKRNINNNFTPVSAKKVGTILPRNNSLPINSIPVRYSNDDKSFKSWQNLNPHQWNKNENNFPSVFPMKRNAILQRNTRLPLRGNTYISGNNSLKPLLSPLDVVQSQMSLMRISDQERNRNVVLRNAVNIRNVKFPYRPIPHKFIQGKAYCCTFCRANNEIPMVYESHTLHHEVTKALACPILRRLVCSVCGATGDNAHTLSYCPVRKILNGAVKPRSMFQKIKKTARLASGKIRIN